MDVSPYRRTEQTTIDASPADVYALVSDVTRMGEWSPVSEGADWEEEGGSPPSVGDWFAGHNAVGENAWTTRCKVVVADPGHEFTFVNHGESGSHERVRWGFVLEPVDGGGTVLTQTWEVLPDYATAWEVDGHSLDDLPAVLDLLKGMAETGMAETVAGIKQAAEQT